MSGERTYSRTVERALQEFVNRAKARRILDLAGSGAWEGDLSVVREDRGRQCFWVEKGFDGADRSGYGCFCDAKREQALTGRPWKKEDGKVLVKGDRWPG